MQNQTRRPLRFTLSVCVLALYLSWMVGRYLYDAVTIHKFEQAKSRKALITHTQMGYVLLKHNEFEILDDRLREAKNRGELLSYQLKKNDEVELEIDRSEVIPLLDPSENLEMRHTDAYSYTRVMNGPYTLTLVIHDSIREYLLAHLKVMLPILMRDLAICAFFTAWVMLYFLKDIVHLMNVLGSRRERKFSNISARSAEGAVLMRGLNAMEASLGILKAENKVLKNQVLSALNSELQSGRKPPYEFECTLVRVDVNNFSYIFNHHPVEEFMSVINDFFHQVTEIVSRYNGYVYEFVGDEVIFYFKDTDHLNSSLTAISALRDISAAAVELDEQIFDKNGYNFRIKCSAAHGRLRFGPQVNGYSLAGSILIDTVRILSLISERESNSIFYPRDLHEVSRPLVKSEPQTQAVLKGSSHAMEIWSYKGHQELNEILDALTPETATALNFYRSDAHLCTILKYLRDHARHMDPKTFITICAQLRNITLVKSSAAVTEQYRLLIKEMIRYCIGTVSHVDDEFRLSSVISVAMHVLDQHAFDTDLKSFFNDCLKLKNRRVVANALDVFSYFQSVDDSEAIRELLNHKDNRVAANALIREGIKGLNKHVVKHLSKMLKAADPSFHASGLYVLGELAQHHKHSNPVYYETNVSFHRLFSEIEYGLLDANAMVRRQALIAGKKVSDPRVNKAIMHYYSALKDPAKRDEVEELFLEQTQLKAAA